MRVERRYSNSTAPRVGTSDHGRASHGSAPRHGARHSEYHRGAAGKALLFFAALLVLMVVSLIPSLHPKESVQERRELVEFPKFSVETLLNGEYFSGIDSWFSDTFPGRDSFLKANQTVRSLYGVRTVEITGEVTQGDDIPDVPFTGD